MSSRRKMDAVTRAIWFAEAKRKAPSLLRRIRRSLRRSGEPTVLGMVRVRLRRWIRGTPDLRPLPVTLPDGSPAVVVPLRPDHAPLLASKLAGLSARSRSQRFLFPKARLTSRELAYLTHCDGIDHIALALVVTEKGGERIESVAVARCVRDRRRRRLAEVAITVTDEWQGRGVGKTLLRELARRARSVGIRTWRGVMWADNAAARNLLEDTGELVRERRQSEQVTEVEYRIG